MVGGTKLIVERGLQIPPVALLVVGTCQLACGSSVDLPSVASVVLVLEKASQTPSTDSPAAETLQSRLVTPVLRSKNVVILPLFVDFTGEVVDLVTFLLGFNDEPLWHWR